MMYCICFANSTCPERNCLIVNSLRIMSVSYYTTDMFTARLHAVTSSMEFPDYVR